MKFSEIIDQASALLQRKGRITYRSLKREFELDDEGLEDLKFELIEGQELAVDKDDKMLVWTGEGESASVPTTPSPQPQSQSPASYTPQHLAERIRAEQQAMESRGATNGERKTITALFADLKGSTALIEGLDPEEARAIIDPALQLMMDAVHRYDGYVAQALGDGIFALFGAPIAHEDHPQRALYAALWMQEEMRGYADTLREQGRPPLLMRVGLNTGEVVVRSIQKDDLHADYVPVGHSTNVAARMEQLAAPGSILVSEYTHKLTDGYFAFKDMGKTQIKGVDEPLNVYEVVGAGPLRTRLQVSARRGLTRFVGRQSEMEQLQHALDQATAGHGQIVGVMGEPGLGKSRLFHEFKLTSQSGCLVLEAFGVSHGQASPYLPMIELLKEYFQIQPGDDERARKEKVAGKVLILDRSIEEILPYLFALLSIEDEQGSLQQMDPQIRRQRTFEALKKLFLRESLNCPLVLVVEDLHWIDSETQGFLDTLTESVASAQLLLLVNFRPEYRHEWGAKTYYTQLRLSSLGKSEAEEFLTFLIGTDASLTALKELILERTDGTPFFMEEVVQTLAEEGSLIGERGNYSLEVTPTALHISPTVQGVLAARIDRLPPDEKILLQHLSVIGRQFPASLVKQVVTQREDELYQLLASLQAKEFLYEQPAFPESEFIFKHALTQDIAYGTVLQEQRKALHERTGQALETLHAEKLDDRYSELAHHYGLSGNTEKAVEYLSLAGQQAVQRSANVEAVEQLTTALELLQMLPEERDRAEQELQLQLALGPAVLATTSYSAPELARTYTRALELSRQLNDQSHLFIALRGLWYYSFVGGDEYEKSLELGKQLVELANQSNSSAHQIEAHYTRGAALLFQGALAEGRAHLEQVVSLYDPNQHASLRASSGQDPGVASRGQLCQGLWALGYPVQAQQARQEALTLAQEISHTFTSTSAFGMASAMYVHCRDYSRARDDAEAALALSAKHGFAWWTAMGNIFHGKALAALGQPAEGIVQIRQGIMDYQALGAATWVPYYLALLAEEHGRVGDVEEGLVVVAEGLGRVEKTGERWSEAELYRLKGELLLEKFKAQSLQFKEGTEEAEVCFHEAIVIAQKQEAKSWELRAATSLVRLWQGQGKRTEAHALLAPVYNWFTEGFDTADLKDAKTLLDELT